MNLHLKRAGLGTKEPVSCSERWVFPLPAGQQHTSSARALVLVKNATTAVLCRGIVGFVSLPEESVDSAVVVSLLKRYGKANVLSACRRVHAHIIKFGIDRTTFIGNCIVEMYGNRGSLEDARAVFEQLPNPDIFSWNMVIHAYCKNGQLDDAHIIFDSMLHRNVVSWNAMISTLAQNARGKEALVLFRKMQLESVKPNRITFVSTLDACADLAALAEGLEIHSIIDMAGIELDVITGTALINMYGKCGTVCEARNVFSRMPHRDAITWTAMIGAFVENGKGKEALDLFYQMQCEGFKPDRVSFVCAVEACASMVALKEGQEVHAAIVEFGYQGHVVVENALINMYGKCGSLRNARGEFSRMPHPDVVSWTAIIAAYTKNGNSTEALNHFRQMQLEGIRPNKITILHVLDSCASLAAVDQGKEIHAMIMDLCYKGDVEIGNAIINMYGKFGSLHDAWRVFCEMPQRDVVSWTAMIAVFAYNGHAEEALDLFNRMELNGIKPNKITFVSALTACSHSGRIDDGRSFFVSMNRDHGLTHTEDHYVCMIDLLGRAGHLDEAEALITHCPFGKAGVAWLCLLSACKMHGDVQRGVRAAEQCFELNPTDITPYVTLSNMYAAAGRWDDVANVQKTLKDSDMVK